MKRVQFCCWMSGGDILGIKPHQVVLLVGLELCFLDPQPLCTFHCLLSLFLCFFEAPFVPLHSGHFTGAFLSPAPGIGLGCTRWTGVSSGNRPIVLPIYHSDVLSLSSDRS